MPVFIGKPSYKRM